MRRTLTALAAPLAALLLLTGCTAEPDEDSGSAPASTTSSATAPDGSPDVSPSETEGATGPPAPDLCETLGAGAVGEVLGSEVERTALADRGCRYASGSDPSAPSVGLVQGPVQSLGGLDGARAGISAVIDGEVRRLDVGDGGFLVVGESFGGTTLAGGGAVRLGDSIVQITLLPGDEGVPREETRRTTEELLRLVATGAGR